MGRCHWCARAVITVVTIVATAVMVKWLVVVVIVMEGQLAWCR